MDESRKPGSRDGDKSRVKHRVNRNGLALVGASRKAPEAFIQVDGKPKYTLDEATGLRHGVKYSLNKGKNWELVDVVKGADDAAVVEETVRAYEKRRTLPARQRNRQMLSAEPPAKPEPRPSYADVVKTRRGPTVKTNVPRKQRQSQEPPAQKLPADAKVYTLQRDPTMEERRSHAIHNMDGCQCFYCSRPPRGLEARVNGKVQTQKDMGVL